MDRKVRERRRTVHRERGRRRAVVAGCVIAVLILLAVFLWLRSSSVFAVKVISFNRLTHVSSQTISEATAAAKGVNLLRLDSDSLKQELLAIPYVKTVSIHRKFPNTIELTLSEYKPVACLQMQDGSSWLVSAEGRILEQKTDRALPVVVSEVRVLPKAGATLPAAVVGALQVATAVTDKTVAAQLHNISQIKVAAQGELTVVLANSVELRLGQDTDLNQKLREAAAIVQQYLRDGKGLTYIDVSVPGKAAVNEK